MALVPLLLAAGCGGDDEPSASSASPTTAAPSPPAASATAGADDGGKTAYLTAAEAICSAANDTISAQPEINPAAGAAAVVAGFDAGVSLLNTATTQLLDLTRARPDAAQVMTIFLTPVQAQVTALKAYEATLSQALTAGTPPAPPQLPMADLTAMKTYGFSACVTLAQK